MYLLKKKQLAAAVAVSSAIFLAACGESESSTPVDAQENQDVATTSTPLPDIIVSPIIEIEQKVDFTEVTAPRGMVTGSVVDSNGNPLAGVKVGVAGQIVETNELGTYVFEDVRATGVDTIDASRTQFLQVTILGGAVDGSNYMGAKVNVLPRAQIFEGESFAGGVDAQTNVTFVDGFIAEAGVAVLPELNASLAGRLIDQSNGQPLANITVALDVDTVTGEIAIGNELVDDVSGLQTIYASASLPTVTTGDNGYFRFDNLPADTSFSLAVENEVERSFSIQTPVFANTDDEDITTDLGALQVAVTEFVDDVAPYIERITNVIAEAGVGQIVRNSNQVELIFSEPVDVRDLTTIRASAIKGAEGDAITSRVPVTASQGADKTRLSLAFESADVNNTLDVVKGQKIEIYIPRGVVVDTSNLKNGLVGDTLANDSVEFATTIAGDEAKNTAAHVKVSLTNYDDLKLDNIAVVPSQLKLDDTSLAQDLDVIQTQSNSFADTNDVEVGIQQLNVEEAKGRLDALLTAYTDKLALDGAAVVTTVARVSIDTSPSGAAYFEARVIDGVTGDTKTGAQISFVNAPNSVKESSATGVNTFYVKTGGDAVQEALVSNIVPGDILEVTSFDSFNTPGTPVTQPLVDNVPPTTALQFAYDTDPGETTTKVEFYGQGGELSSYTGTQTEIGMPVLPLTPRLLVEVDGTDNGPNNEVGQLSELRKLFNLNTTSINAEVDIVGKPIIKPETGIYDKNAYQAFRDTADLSGTIGVAFTESVKLVDASQIAYSNSAAAVSPSDWTVANDIVATDVAGTVDNVDLLQFTLSDVYDFALEQSGAFTFDFTGAVSDLAGNLADQNTNAKVQIEDQIPPFVVTAKYYIEQTLTDFPTDAIEVVFDKPVATVVGGNAVLTESNITFDLGGTEVTIDGSEDYIVSADALNTIVLLPAAWGGDLTKSSVFTLPAYQDTGDKPFQTTAFANAHAAFSFENIPAVASGKDWADYSTLVKAPKFALNNDMPAFEANSFTLESGAGTKELEVKVNVKHALNDERLVGAGKTITDEETVAVAGLFSVAQGALAETVTSVTVTRGAGIGNYTFTITLENDRVAGPYTVQTINTGTAVLQSGFDKTETILNLGVDGVTATLN